MCVGAGAWCNARARFITRPEIGAGRGGRHDHDVVVNVVVVIAAAVQPHINIFFRRILTTVEKSPVGDGGDVVLPIHTQEVVAQLLC